jgi:GTP-binding protein
MIDITSEDYSADYKTLLNELDEYSKVLSEKKKLLAFTKADLLSPAELKKISRTKIRGYKGPILIFSAVTKYGIQELLDVLWQQIKD